MIPTIIEQPKRKWQFLKYGDGALLLCQQCRNRCHPFDDKNRWFGWQIPARTVKILYPLSRPKGGTRRVISTINFKEGCNLYRAKLLRDIVKAQNSKALPSYKNSPETNYYKETRAKCYESLYGEPTLELFVDGKPIANISGDYKRGVIKDALKPYTTKARVGKHTVTWDFGEADRVPLKNEALQCKSKGVETEGNSNILGEGSCQNS